MPSRKLRWVLVLAGLAVLTAGAFLLWSQSDRITEANFDRVRLGMSRAEVEGILGPPGDRRRRPRSDNSRQASRLGDSTPREFIWLGDTGLNHVRFDATGSSDYMGWEASDPNDPGLFGKFLCQLGELLDRLFPSLLPL